MPYSGIIDVTKKNKIRPIIAPLPVFIKTRILPENMSVPLTYENVFVNFDADMYYKRTSYVRVASDVQRRVPDVIGQPLRNFNEQLLLRDLLDLEAALTIILK